MNRKSLLASIALIGLAGCVTREEQEAVELASRQSHVGQSVAEFVVQTGHTPAEATPLAPDRRLFVFYGRTVAVGMPANGFNPAVASSFTCKVKASSQADRATASFKLQPCLWSRAVDQRERADLLSTVAEMRPRSIAPRTTS